MNRQSLTKPLRPKQSVFVGLFVFVGMMVMMTMFGPFNLLGGAAVAAALGVGGALLAQWIWKAGA